MSADREAGSFGSKLRKARERRAISLREIANTTKISIAALEALERDDISRLPGGIFSRAFVRSYATAVGLDPEEAIQDFITQFPNDAVTAGHPASNRGDDGLESERQTAGTFLWLAVVSIPLAVMLVYFSKGRSAPRGSASARQSSALSTQPPSRPAAPEVRSAPAPSQQPLPPQPSLPPPTQTERVALTEPGENAAPNADARDQLRVDLSVRARCWVSATVDGQKELERLMEAGERHTIDVRRELVLTAGDAAAVAVTLNGAEARPLGKPGEVVTVRFSPANFNRYLQPR